MASFSVEDVRELVFNDENEENEAIFGDSSS